MHNICTRSWGWIGFEFDGVGVRADHSGKAPSGLPCWVDQELKSRYVGFGCRPIFFTPRFAAAACCMRIALLGDYTACIVILLTTNRCIVHAFG